MPLFSQKKPRISRSAKIGAEATLSGRFEGAMRDRSLIIRLMLCLLVMLALVVAVESWRSPFLYRQGDLAHHGILAAVKFNLVNRNETLQLKAEKEAEVPFIFQHNPEPLQNLESQLKSDIEEVAVAETIDDLSPRVRAAFGFLQTEDRQPQNASVPSTPNQLFLELKNAGTADPNMEETQLDQVISEFSRFVAPLEETGIVDPRDLESINFRPGQKLVILQDDDPESILLVSANEVRLSELLKESGLLGQSWSAFPLLSPIRQPLEKWLTVLISPTLRFDSAATQKARQDAREKVKDVFDQFNPGDILVAPGSKIDESSLAVLHAEYDQREKTVSLGQRSIRTLIVFLMIAVLIVLNGFYMVHSEPQLVRSIGHLSIFLFIIVIAVALGRFLSYNSHQAEIIPLAVTVMVFAIAYNQMLAILTALTLCLILSLSTFGNLGHFVILLSVSATAIIPLTQVASRSTLIKVGFVTAIVYFVMSWGVGVIEAQSLEELISDRALLLESLYGAGWCLAAGYLVAGSLPFIESAFGIVTNISLLEMSDVSHPLLQELVRRAPGTYNHSISVASIGETAADRIGANGLLVRVGAYFHDIGKMLKPQYFVENYSEGVESPHLHLAPAMSTLIIIGHVKDGVDLALQHNLPQQLINFIEQHHGTTLVQYFFHAATKQADSQPDHRTDAEEASFRYPGPKPQTREAGVMMLADAVESASRTLSDPTAKRIENLVHEITLDRLQDGQFDESFLTMAEIRIIEESLTKSLIGIYHGRIKYPEQRTA